MTDYTITSEINNHTLIIFITGEIDFTNYDDFRNELFNIVNSSLKNSISSILFNLKDTELISSNGWGIFYELNDSLENRNLNVTVKFTELNPVLTDIAQTLKFFDEFKLYEK